MNSDRLKERILAKRSPALAAGLEEEAQQQGASLSIQLEQENGAVRLLLSGDRLLERHYGSQQEAPSALVTRLIQSFAQKRRHQS